MPTTGGHLPAQQPSCFPIGQALVLEAALTSKSVSDMQTRPAGFENWKDKVQLGTWEAKLDLVELLFVAWSVEA